MSLFNRISHRIVSRSLALAAAGAIGLAAMGDVAQAKGEHGVKAPAALQIADRGRVYHTRCDTNAFRRGGARLKGVHGEAVRNTKRSACNVAMNECRQELRRLQKRTGRYPAASCRVTGAKRVAIRGRDHDRKGARIILKF